MDTTIDHQDTEDALFGLIATERRRIADELAALDADAWNVESLCTGWRVHEVAAHLTGGWNISTPRFALGMMRSRGDLDKALDRFARKLAEASPGDIVGDLHANAGDRFTPPGFGAAVPLADVVIHAHDILRPLGQSSGTPVATFRPVLDTLVPASKKNPFPLDDSSGLRFVATDQDWSHGSGQVIEGTSADLALALTGRRSGFAELAGDGVDEFCRRSFG